MKRRITPKQVSFFVLGTVSLYAAYAVVRSAYQGVEQKKPEETQENEASAAKRGE